MNSPKYNIVGIVSPGLVNILLDGRFQNVKLHEADEATLDKLYADGCSYIQLTLEGVLKENPGLKSISSTPIPKAKKKNS